MFHIIHPMFHTVPIFDECSTLSKCCTLSIECSITLSECATLFSTCPGKFHVVQECCTLSECSTLSECITLSTDVPDCLNVPHCPRMFYIVRMVVVSSRALRKESAQFIADELNEHHWNTRPSIQSESLIKLWEKEKENKIVLEKKG